MRFDRWNLTESPFAAPLERRGFYDSPAHEEALARLYFLIEERRPVGWLTGLPGTGKSLLLKHLEQQIRRSSRDVCRIDLAGCGAEEFINQLAGSLGHWGRRVASPSAIWTTLQAQVESLPLVRRPLVLLLDHCDRTSDEGVAVVERLASLGTRVGGYLILIAAFSSPPSGTAFQRLREQCSLLIPVLPLKRRETSYFIYQTLEKAGGAGELFTPEAADTVHQLCDGVPGRILRLCDLSLLAAYGAGCRSIDAELVRQVASELLPRQSVNFHNAAASTIPNVNSRDASTRSVADVDRLALSYG